MRGRIDWVDIAKGFCIVFVVMMHSTLGVEAAAGEEGWMHALVAFAKPFRMPDFFLLAGLFLSARIRAPWPLYLDRKVVHFAYFYVLWLTIQFAFKAPGYAAELGWEGALGLYLRAFIDPFGTLWFIYHLALFFLVTRLLERVPRALVWAAAAALEIAPIATGSVLIDEFASRFVYFYSGYILAPLVFRLAAAADRRRLVALGALLLWGLVNGALVFAGLSELPFVGLALGFAGAAAVVTVSVLLARTFAAVPLTYLGQNSIVVYLAFFLPMAASRAVLLKTGIVSDVGTVSLLVTIAGVIGPVVFYKIVEATGWGRFLFERPGWAHIDGSHRREKATIAPAE